MQPTGLAKSCSRAAYRTTPTVDLLRITGITGVLGRIGSVVAVALSGHST